MELHDNPSFFASRRARNRFIVHTLVVTLILLVGFVLVRRHFAFLTDPADVRLYVQSFGRWAPVVLITLQALQVVVAPVPGHILAAVAGFLFGSWWGTLYNMIGITLGSATAFWLSRRFGRSYVERMIAVEALASFDGFIERHGLLSLFVLFLIPGLPDDALCFVGGLTPIPLWKLILIAIVGRVPAFFLVNVFGDLVATGQRDEALLLLAFIVGISIIGLLNRDRLMHLFEPLR